MMEYDKTQPLISLHVPKMAGTSFKVCLKQVFGPGLLDHYNKNVEIAGRSILRYPERYIWQTMLDVSRVQPICIHGHFRNTEKSSAADFYPLARQFSILLRDPLETVLSNYRYQRKIESLGHKTKFPFKSINEYVERVSCLLRNHVPVDMWDDCKSFLEDRCVLYGCLENLTRFAENFKKAFGRSLDMPRVNESFSEETVDPAIAKAWKERNARSYDIYEYALSQ